MRLVVLALAFSNFCAFAAKGVLVEQQAMELKTPEGMTILLNPDSSWQFKDGKPATIEQDFTVPVGGGRIILITQDGRWGFTDKEIINSSAHLLSDSIIAMGKTTNMDLTTATNTAQKQALKEMNMKIRGAIKKFTLDPTKLEACIRDVQKAVVKNENFVKGSGWNVMVNITVDRGGLLAITECAKKPEPAPKAGAKKK
jgi:hypothetical protein